MIRKLASVFACIVSLSSTSCLIMSTETPGKESTTIISPLGIETTTKKKKCPIQVHYPLYCSKHYDMDLCHCSCR